MWHDMVRWLIAVFTLAVGAGWIVSGQTRTLRRLKMEAELLEKLPSSTAKEVLARQIREDVLEYTWLKHTEALRRLAFWSRVVEVAAPLLLFGVFAMAAWALITRNASLWLAVPAVGVAAAGGVLSVVSIRLRRRMDRDLQRRRIEEG